MNTSNILHIMVVGFHHKKGCEIEFCWPPLGNNELPNEDDIPLKWANLSSLSMPDGAHNLDKDVVYFLLPSLETPNRAVFGISCYRQIATKDLKAIGNGVTRSSVQKAVVIISKIPLYGALRLKIEDITKSYFDEKDFSLINVLKEAYMDLNNRFKETDTKDETSTAAPEVSLKAFLNGVIGKPTMLSIFKLILLEKKVLFHIFPAQKLGDIMLGIASLFPLTVQDGLFEGADYSLLTKCNSNSEIINKDICKHDKYGFPLSLFTKGYLFHPYLSVIYMDMIKSESTRALCVGATNALFKQKREWFDAIIFIDEKEELIIDTIDPHLKKKLMLTNEDLRFIENISKQLNDSSSHISQLGTDEWVRSQFEGYLISLLFSSKMGIESILEQFNEDFVEDFKSTLNYRVWNSQNYDDIEATYIGHPFSSSSDNNLANISSGIKKGKRMVSSNITTSKRYVSEATSKVRHSLTSLFKKST